ncbi:MAG TPA: DNA sulfur modification protein DndB [Iamia sp.]
MNSHANMLSVPATRGRMGSSEYFTANFPMGMVVKLFAYDPEKMPALPPEQRTQRALKKNRVPEIAEYVLDHEDYLFSSITVSVDAERLAFDESELDPNLGMLRLPMEAEWIVNDGQHRVAGIAEAMAHDATLKYDNLSVVILPDGGLERSQQVFSDLNRTVQKTSKSLDILFDHRSPINRITTACVGRVPLFTKRIDKERVSLSIRSKDFATLSGVQAATSQLLGHIPEQADDDAVQEQEDLAVEFWTFVTDVVEPWAEIAAGDVRPADARAEYLSSYALALWAVGSVGRSAIDDAERNGGDWRSRLGALTSVDWLKTNDEWQGICMIGKDVVTRVPTRKATADLLRWKTGLGPRPAGVLD